MHSRCRKQGKVLRTTVLTGAGAFLLFLFPPRSAPAEISPSPVDFESVAPQLQTPEALAEYMNRNFTFVADGELFQKTEHWQTPEEMFLRKAGDCEDYALFAEAVLHRSRSQVFLFSVFGDEDAHTVTIFQEGNRWGVFDSGKFYFSDAGSLPELAGEINPNWSYSGLMRREGNFGIITRKFKNR